MGGPELLSEDCPPFPTAQQPGGNPDSRAKGASCGRTGPRAER